MVNLHHLRRWWGHIHGLGDDGGGFLEHGEECCELSRNTVREECGHDWEVRETKGQERVKERQKRNEKVQTQARLASRLMLIVKVRWEGREAVCCGYLTPLRQLITRDTEWWELMTAGNWASWGKDMETGNILVRSKVLDCLHLNSSSTTCLSLICGRLISLTCNLCLYSLWVLEWARHCKYWRSEPWTWVTHTMTSGKGRKNKIKLSIEVEVKCSCFKKKKKKA